jgi:predicted deacylase
MNQALRIGGEEVPPGQCLRLELPVARLFTGNWLSLPVSVVNGAAAGPRLWLSAAIHGDELNGMEIIRRVLLQLDALRLRGAVIAVPVVNVFGFLERNRYLPDRRDLNRSFPGSRRGSLASRLANLFVNEVVAKCDYGLDFHTGSRHRENLPQIRGHLEHPEIRRLAEAFGAPSMLRPRPLRGSLRSTARRRGIPYLLFEGGEPLRFNDHVIACGVAGTLRVLNALGMADFDVAPAPPSFEAKRTRWQRASRSGILQLAVDLGERVSKGQILGHIAVDFFSDKAVPIRAPDAALVIGHTNNPLVNQGDALIHLAIGKLRT